MKAVDEGERSGAVHRLRRLSQRPSVSRSVVPRIPSIAIVCITHFSRRVNDDVTIMEDERRAGIVRMT